MKKIRAVATRIAEKSVFFRNILRKTLNILRKIKYKLNTLGVKVDDNIIIFCSFNGKSYSCSPKAIYNFMLNNDEYANFKFVWAFDKKDKYDFLKENKNTLVVKINSKEYQKYLATAKYWIFNYKIPDYLYPKKNQVFMQCWHGTPLKRLGCDLIHFDNVLNTMKGMKKRYKIEASKFTYFLSPSKFASEKFISAWNLKEIGKENIIVEKGYPRNDFLYKYTDEDIKKIKERLHIENNEKKMILYAPTWRDNQHKAGVGYTYELGIDFDKLKAQLEDEFIILFRPHYFVANQFDFKKYEGFIYDVSKVDDINDVYVLADMLITDYSSVFFDYANLKRPMLFYMYDLTDYKEHLRGFYISLDELPGPIVEKEDDLINEIKKVATQFTYDDKYKKFNDKYNYLEDGNAAKRVIEECITLE